MPFVCATEDLFVLPVCWHLIGQFANASGSFLLSRGCSVGQAVQAGMQKENSSYLNLFTRSVCGFPYVSLCVSLFFGCFWGGFLRDVSAASLSRTQLLKH